MPRDALPATEPSDAGAKPQVSSMSITEPLDPETKPQVSSTAHRLRAIGESSLPTTQLQFTSLPESEVSQPTVEPQQSRRVAFRVDLESGREVNAIKRKTDAARHSFTTIHISRGTAPDITIAAPNSLPLQDTPVEKVTLSDKEIGRPEATSDVIFESLKKIVKKSNAATQVVSIPSDNNFTPVAKTSAVSVISLPITEVDVPSAGIRDATANGTSDDVFDVQVPDTSEAVQATPGNQIDLTFAPDTPEARAVENSTPSPASEALPSVASAAHVSRLTPVRGSGRVLPYTLFKSLVCCFAPHTATH